MQANTWQGRAAGRWVVITSEATFSTHDVERAHAEARDCAAQLGCMVPVLDTHDGSTAFAMPDGDVVTSASIRAAIRRAARVVS